MNLTSQKLLQKAIEIVEDKKAKDVVLLNLKKIFPIIDYFVICTGDSSPHMKSIAQALEKELEEKGIKQLNRRHFGNDLWILLDFGSLVVHIFSKSGRDFYQLERLWADAGKRV
jgi:ribosome-associated protein